MSAYSCARKRYVTGGAPQRLMRALVFVLWQGDGLHYQHLVAQLLTRDDPETLWRLYLGLSECVTIITQQ